MSVRLHIVVEGQTEETFIHGVLKQALADYGVFVDVHGVTTSCRRGKLHRGGGRHYRNWRTDLHLWMKQDQNSDAYFTTMLDVYGLDHFQDGFPGLQEAKRQHDPYKRVALLEEAFAGDINHRRFIPYLQLHEFEALIFAAPKELDRAFPEHDEPISRLTALVEEQPNPELIDDGEMTSPAKRIIKEIPEYEGRKVTAGPLVVEKIGLTILRRKCKHFNDWLCQLEALGKS